MRVRVASLLVAAAVAATAQAQVVRRVSKVPLPDRDITDVVVSDDGSTFLAISTEGSAANPYRHPRLVRRDAATGEWIALSEERAGGTILVSDDGQTIAFAFKGSDPSGISLVDPAGGPPVQLTEPNFAIYDSTAVMSGDGSAIFVEAFVPDRSLYRIETDGTGSTEIVGDWEHIGQIAASDDGARIAFVGRPTASDAYSFVYAIEGDGSGLRQLSPMAVGENTRVRMSGNGSRVGWGGGVRTIAWDGTEYQEFESGTIIGLNHHGSIVVYRRDDSIRSAPVTAPTLVSVIVPGPIDPYSRTRFAQFGNAIVFRTPPEGYPGIPDDDGTGEWALTDARGDDLQAITSIDRRDPQDVYKYGELALTPDGELIVARAFYEDGEALVAMPTDGSGETTLSTGTDPVITDDGEWIYYEASPSLTDPDCQNGTAIFRMRSDGTERARIYPLGACDTPVPPAARTPRLARDAGRVYFREGSTIFSTTLDGDDPRVELNGISSKLQYLSPSGDGRVIGWSETDFGPGEIVDLDGLTLFSGTMPDVSRNGAWAVYAWSPPWGVTLAEVVTGELQYFSTLPGGTAWLSRISGDGQWILYYSGPLVRLNRVTGVSERVSGTFGVPEFGYTVGRIHAISHDGSRIAFTNPWTSTVGGIYFADMHELQTWTIPRAEPFELAWSDDPRASGYDVIRGDLAALAAAGDGTVDLGDVTCLIDDAYRPAASEDPADAIPAPGSGYFYLFRPTLIEGDEGYGASSGGDQRLPATGDCPAAGEAAGS